MRPDCPCQGRPELAQQSLLPRELHHLRGLANTWERLEQGAAHNLQPAAVSKLLGSKVEVCLQDPGARLASEVFAEGVEHVDVGPGKLLACDEVGRDEQHATREARVHDAPAESARGRL
eukprot:9503784-Pyramimonas_sp.AAC.1